MIMVLAAVTFWKYGIEEIDGSMGVLGLLSSHRWSSVNCAVVRMEST